MFVDYDGCDNDNGSGLSALFKLPYSTLPENLVKETNSLQKILLIVLKLGRTIYRLQGRRIYSYCSVFNFQNHWFFVFGNVTI